MANLVWLTHLDNYGAATATTITTTTASATYPASNLKLLPVTKVWRSTSVAAAQDIALDLGSAKSITLLALVNHNLTSAATIAIDAGTTAAVANYSTTMTWRELLAFKYIAAQSYRYWRLRITDTANTDGYIEVGYVMVGTATAPSFGIRMPMTSTPEFQNLDVGSEFGIPNISELFRRQRLVMSFGPIATSTDMATLRNMYLAVKRNVTPLILVPQSDGADAYFGRIQNMFDETMEFYSSVRIDFVEDGYGKRIAA